MKKKKPIERIIACITITPNVCEYPDREKKADEIVRWLISIKAIKPALSYCTDSGELGFAVDIGAKAISQFPDALPFHLKNNGMEPMTHYGIFTPAKTLEHFDCPICKEELDNLDVDAYLHRHYVKFDCKACGISSPIQDWNIVPEWSFSNLAFMFCNWPDFTDEFLKEFSLKLGTPLKIIKVSP